MPIIALVANLFGVMTTEVGIALWAATVLLVLILLGAAFFDFMRTRGRDKRSR